MYAQNNSPNRKSINLGPEITYNSISYNNDPDLLKEYKDSEESHKKDSVDTKFEPLPLLSYDTNTGFGYGAKAFLLNFLQFRESFDFIVFLSTKG
jgi:hypothetical protein